MLTLVYPEYIGVWPMALNLEDKQEIVKEVSEAAKEALSAVVADSRGVTAVKQAFICVLYVTLF